MGLAGGGGSLGTTLSLMDINRCPFITKTKRCFSHYLCVWQACPDDTYYWLEILISIKPKSKQAQGRGSESTVCALPLSAMSCSCLSVPGCAHFFLLLGGHQPVAPGASLQPHLLHKPPWLFLPEDRPPAAPCTQCLRSTDSHILTRSLRYNFSKCFNFEIIKYFLTNSVGGK